MSRSNRIVVLGSLHLDIMVRAPGRPRLGETMVGDAWWQSPGGKGCNQAVAAARHGADVAMIGMVGDDDFGRRLRTHLRNSGVDVAALGIRAGAGTGMSVAIVEPSGDYGAVIVSGVNLTLDAETVRRARGLLATAAILVLQNEVPEDANAAAAQLAHDTGCRVVLNAAPMRPMTEALLGCVDILVCNGLEAESLGGIAVTGLDSAAQAAAALTARVGCVIVTAGSAGLAMATRDGPDTTLPAHPVTVHSTHGAGDMFVGALASRLAAGQTLDAALAYANAAAALLVGAAEQVRGTLGPGHVAQLLAGQVARD